VGGRLTVDQGREGFSRFGTLHVASVVGEGCLVPGIGKVVGSTPVQDDEQIMRAAAAGDRAALAAFVRSTQDHVWRYCAYLGRGDDVADLVQETYARALRSLPRFEGRTSGRVWLLAIARRVCADAVRSAQRRRAIEARWRRERLASDTSETVTIELLLSGLTPERREAFVLTQIVGLPYASAAEVCRVPIGTIRSRVARAREQLQTSLRHEQTG
jgi:RNA polymerase sigma-70 factor (ECF subfamily)